jgi:hypothetical protein
MGAASTVREGDQRQCRVCGLVFVVTAYMVTRRHYPCRQCESKRDRERREYKTPAYRERKRRWRMANIEKYRRCVRESLKRGRAERRYQRPRSVDDAHKSRARTLLNRAVAKGLIERLPCERCGHDERVEAHHSDYSRPLDVNWLCKLCHEAVHHYGKP